MLHAVLFAAILLLTGGPAQADRLGDVVTWPAGPAVLKTGNQVRVQWYYLIEDRAGARIFARPMKDGAPAPGYAASGSPLYRGEGQGTADFTLRRPGDVDAIRIQIVGAGDDVRHQTVVPVQLRFAENPMGQGAGAPLRVLPGAIRPQGRPQAAPQPGGDVQLDIESLRPLLRPDLLRPMLNRDLFTRLTPALPDRLELPDGTMVTKQTLASVPPPVDSGSVDAQWIAGLERWLGHIAMMQGFDIMRLMGDSAEFEQYMQMEQADGPSVYEVLDRRRKTIGNLLDGL